jgi:hypothetical protein
MTLEEKASTTVRDYVSEIRSTEIVFYALIKLAGEAVAEAVWRFEDQIELEQVFELSTESTLSILRSV